jgi:hypothetical protein
VFCVVSMDWIYIFSLSSHVLTVCTYAHCLYICHVASDVTFDFILITTELMLCCQWCCFVLNFCQFWAYALVPTKFRMLHNMSTCIVFVDMLTEFLRCLYAFLIKWWLTCSENYCLCRYAHCFYRCSLFWYMLTEFTYDHCFDICSLFLHMLTILIYAHYFYICSLSIYICSLSLYTLTIFTYAHYVYMWSLFLYTLTVFTYGHCFYICSPSLHMLTILIYAH